MARIMLLLVSFLLLTFLDFLSSQQSDQVCIKWDKKVVPRVFVDEIYKKYSTNGRGKTNEVVMKMQKKEFEKLLKNLRIGNVKVQCEEGDDECLQNKAQQHSQSVVAEGGATGRRSR